MNRKQDLGHNESVPSVLRAIAVGVVPLYGVYAQIFGEQPTQIEPASAEGTFGAFGAIAMPVGARHPTVDASCVPDVL